MVIVAAGILSAFSPNYTLLIILGCFLGFGVGGGQVFSLWYLEFVPTQNRGKWMILYSSFWTFGSVIEASLGWVSEQTLFTNCLSQLLVVITVFFVLCVFCKIVMPRLGWRWLIAFTTLPSILVLFFSTFPPESPRFLCVKGRIHEAQNVLKKLEKWNRSKLPSGILVHDQIQDDDDESKQTPLLSSSSSDSTERRKKNTISTNLSSVLTLFSSKLIRITIPLWIFFFGIIFLYYGIILMTSEFNRNSSCNSSTNLPPQMKNKNNMYLNVFITSLAGNLIIFLLSFFFFLALMEFFLFVVVVVAETPGLIFAAIMVDKLGRKITMGLSCSLSFIILMPLILHQNETVTTALLFGARMFIISTTTVLVTYAREVKVLGKKISILICMFVCICAKR